MNKNRYFAPLLQNKVCLYELFNLYLRHCSHTQPLKKMISPFANMGYFNKFLSINMATCEDKKQHYRQLIRDIANKCKSMRFDIVKQAKNSYAALLHDPENKHLIKVRFENCDILKALKYVTIEEIQILLTD